jgi:hypothetical protein
MTAFNSLFRFKVEEDASALLRAIHSKQKCENEDATSSQASSEGSDGDDVDMEED